jgi:hypothetical protein
MLNKPDASSDKKEERKEGDPLATTGVGASFSDFKIDASA